MASLVDYISEADYPRYNELLGIAEKIKQTHLRLNVKERL